MFEHSFPLLVSNFFGMEVAARGRTCILVEAESVKRELLSVGQVVKKRKFSESYWVLLQGGLSQSDLSLRY